MNTAHHISIIMPCRNEEEYIEETIRSIFAQKYTQGEIELVVIDGMSDDKTLDILHRLQGEEPRIRIVENTHRTTPQAMNLGLRAAAYELIIRIDAHAKILPGFIEKSVKAVHEDEKVMCAGGRIHKIYTNKLSEIIGLAMATKFGAGNATYRVGGEKKYVDTLLFGIYKKKVFEEIGYFKEELIRNQDDELNYRLTQAGYKILFDPTIESEYYPRDSIKKLNRQYFQYGYWKVYVNKMHKTITTVRQLFPLFFVLGIIGGVLLSVFIPVMRTIFSAGIIGYFALALYFGISSAKDLAKGIKVALIFPVLHWSYGYGYLKGIIHFLILNKKPAEKHKKMSRS